jgi:hypothetical protein
LFWAEPNIKHIYINKMPRLGGRAQVAAILVMLSLELGAPRLAYSYALAAASMLVDSPLREFF